MVGLIIESSDIGFETCAGIVEAWCRVAGRTEAGLGRNVRQKKSSSELLPRFLVNINPIVELA